MANGTTNGRAHVLEISNRANVQKLATEDLTGIVANINNHESGLNTNAHQIGNIAGLQAELDGKQDVLAGYTGSITYVKTVDFVGQNVTTGTINVSNGIITSVV